MNDKTLEAIYDRIYNGDDYINLTTLDISKAIENSFKIVAHKKYEK